VSPWQDSWGTIVCGGISVILAANAFRVGRDSYQWHFYLTLGNFIISFAAYAANAEVGRPSLIAFGYFLLITAGAFFLTIGVLTVFRTPKRVKCLRCEYVSWPRETDDPRTPFDDAEHHQFRQLHWNGEMSRREHDKSGT